MHFGNGRTPRERALRHVAARSWGPALDPTLRVTLNFHPDRLVRGLPILDALAQDGTYRSPVRHRHEQRRADRASRR
jgi:hypothetical protein